MTATIENKKGRYRRHQESYNMKTFVTLLTCLLALVVGKLHADTMILNPSKDAVLYEEALGNLANGAGQHIFAGKSGGTGGEKTLRSLLAFDLVAAGIPSNAIVHAVTLQLTVNTPNVHQGTVRLHRATADWGEGSSQAGSGEARGANPVAPDATWIHREFNTVNWNTPGGDFDAQVSAAVTVTQNFGPALFSGAQLLADVQDMVSNPNNNFGWLLMNTDEITGSNAIRFGSRQNGLSTLRPELEIDFDIPQPPPDSRLVGLWQFEDANDLGKDASSRANHLEAFGMVTNAPIGALGAAVELGGGVADFLGLTGDPGPGSDHLAFPSGIPTNNSYTISTWLKPDPAVVSDAMISWGNFGISNQVVAFRMNGDTGFNHYWWDNDLFASTGSINLKDGAWHHAVAVYSENAAGSDQWIYLDGQLIAERDTDNALHALPENFRIGSANGTGETFDGQLDDIAVFDYGMNAAEVGMLQRGEYGAFTNHPAAYWTGPFGTNGTYNLYEVVGHDFGETASWLDAHAAATNAVDPLTGSGRTGHLVSIANSAENTFVFTIKPLNRDTWIGLSDDPIVGGSEAGNDPNSSGFVWAGSSDTFAYQNFTTGQPDNSGNAIAMWQTAGQWDDTAITGAQRVYIIEWDIGSATPIAGARTLPVLPPAPPPVLPPVLPGPAGEDGAFGGIWVRDNGNIGSLSAATNSLTSGTGTILTTNRIPVVNHHDPEKLSGIDRGLFFDEGPYWANIVGQEDNNFATVYKGTIVIPTGGNYTFGVHSDDGFALRILGGTFVTAYGNGIIDPGSPDTLTFTANTGDSDTRGIINLLAGEYPLEFVTWNGVGGAYHELYAAPGIQVDDGPQFDLIGAPGGVAEIPGIATNSWDVWMTTPGTDGGIANTNTAWSALTNYLPIALGGSQSDPEGSNHFTFAEINFGNGNQGSVGGDNPYPLAGTQNFAIFARTSITITNAGEYVMGFQGDDGGWMRVVGQNWNEIVFKAVAAAYIDGDKIVLNEGTGNSRMFGSMTLTPGTYEVQMLNWQGNGGFHLEALNGVLLRANREVISSLFNNQEESVPYSGGLQLVAPASPMDVVITDIRYDASQDSVSVTFDSDTTASYKLIYSTDNTPGANFDPNTWSDLATGISSGEGTTTVVVPDFLGTPWKDVLDDWIALRVAEE